ncbi:MAG: uroporphyrinogen decarboxylase family protein [Promethearchaeota archaeon]
MTSFSPYERVMTLLQGKLPDRVPVIPQITYTTAQLTGVGLVEALYSAEKTAAALLAGQRELGYDAIYVGWESSFNLLAEAMGCTMRFPADSVPQVAKHVVQSPEDVDSLEIPDPHGSGRLPLHLDLVSRIKTAVSNEIPLFAYTPGPFTLAGQLSGVNSLMMATIQDPAYVKKIVHLTTQASIRYAQANIEAGIDVIVAADPTASGSLISPQTFEAFAAPSLHSVLAAIDQAGAIPSLHICGKTTPILQQMAEVGPVVMELDHLVDLQVAKNLVGTQVILMGNLNPTELLLSGTPEMVELAAKRCIEAVGREGRYILSSGCEIPPLAPLENIRAMVKAAEKYGRFV